MFDKTQNQVYTTGTLTGTVQPDFSPVPSLNFDTVEAEEKVLGAILLDPAEVMPKAESLIPAMFSTRKHRLIFAAIRETCKAGKKPDTLAVECTLRALGNLEDAGGKAKLRQLLDRVEFLDTFDQHVGLLIENYQRNRLMHIAQRLETQSDFGSVLQELKDEIANIGEKGQNDLDTRLRLELQALLAESDPIKYARHKARISTNYSIHKSEIENLLRQLKVQGATAEPSCYSFAELLNLESEGLRWLIPGLLPLGETIICAGAPKSGKTLLAIDAAFAVATGEDDFLGQTVEQGRVLIVSLDESAQSTRKKLLDRGFRIGDSENLQIMTRFHMSQLPALEEKLIEFKPALVVVDSLRRANHGSAISENSAEFADSVYTLKEICNRYKASLILIHHTSKNPEAMGIGQLRGSSAIAGAVWGTWQVEQIPRPDPNQKKKLIFHPKDPQRILSIFARDAEGQRLKVEKDPENNHWLNLGDLEDPEADAQENATWTQRILNILNLNNHLELSGREIIELLNMTPEEGKAVYNTLSRMVGKRLINCRPAPGDKRYNLYSVPRVSKQDPPPPPTMSAASDDYYVETYTQQGIQNSHHISHHPPKISHHPETENEVMTNVNADSVRLSEDSHHLAPQRGGEGVMNKLPEVSDVTASGGTTENPVEHFQENEAIRINCPGSKHHGKTAVIRRFRKNDQGLTVADLEIRGEKGFKYWEAQVSWLSRS